MTTLSDIRDIETRLQSFIPELDDVPLTNELFYLLDDLQILHGELDKSNVPNTGTDGLELNLLQRVGLLIANRRLIAEEPNLDFYGYPLPPKEPTQTRMF